MSLVAQREQIERRLQKIREDKAREQEAPLPANVQPPSGEAHGASATSTYQIALSTSDQEDMLKVNGVLVALGDIVKVKDDSSLLEAAESALPRRDITKSIYLGEKGKVTCILHQFYGKPGVELTFADDAVKFYFAECLDVGVKQPKAKTEVRVPPPVVVPSATATAPASSSAVVEDPEPSSPSAPSWANLRNPKQTAAAAPLDAKTKAEKSPEKIPPPPITAVTRPDKQQEAPPPPAAATSSPPSLARPRVSGYMTLKSLSDEDNLLKTPRNESWMKSTSLMVAQQPDGASSKTSSTYSTQQTSTATGKAGSAIPVTCSTSYTAKFPYPDPRSGIYTAKSADVVVRRCTLISKDVLLSPHTNADFRSIALRENLHDSWPSILAACTNELRWKNTRVERLFTLAGQEIMWPHAIRDGMCLVATSGDAYVVPVKASPQIGVARIVGLPVQRSPASAIKSRTSALSRLALPASLSKVVSSPASSLMNISGGSLGSAPRTLVLKVFPNGEYGDVVSERTPYRTITIRPTHKTLTSVYTTIARELQWNVLGRKCEVLYTACGEQVSALDEIRSGDSLVASSGERYVVPRDNSVLHAEVVALNGGRAGQSSQQPAPAEARAKSPMGVVSRARSPVGQRAKSPMSKAAPPTTGYRPASAPSANSAVVATARPTSMQRAQSLLEEIQRVDNKLKK